MTKCQLHVLKRILCSDWLPERAIWAYPSVPLRIFRSSPARKISYFGHVINPLLAKPLRQDTGY